MKLFLLYWMYLSYQLHNWYYHFLRHKIAIYFLYYHLYRHAHFKKNIQQRNHDENIFNTHPYFLSKLTSQTCSLLIIVNHCFMYTIGIINYLGMQLILPYWMYLSYLLHNWYYHFLRHKIAIYVWYCQLSRYEFFIIR